LKSYFKDIDMRPTFDIDAMRTMVVGTELGSFAKAAIRLGRSQSAISMQMKRLEEQAGRPLFRRNGRNLVPTEAGDALLAYARRIVDLHDEAAVTLGSTAVEPLIRLGLPQDFFEDVMPRAITKFSRLRAHVHVEVRAGRNYALEEEVNTAQLDMALVFFRHGRPAPGELLISLPTYWLAGERFVKSTAALSNEIPLVLFDHPCLFRQSAIHALDDVGKRWRLALTTPSLPGVWGALRFGHGVSVRTMHEVPKDIRQVGVEFRLPRLPAIDLRLVVRSGLSPAATDLRDILVSVVRQTIKI
jgi:DNA-binding transcriptional LysR family regulator